MAGMQLSRRRIGCGKLGGKRGGIDRAAGLTETGAGLLSCDWTRLHRASKTGAGFRLGVSARDSENLASYPDSYDKLVRQVQLALVQAVQEGVQLMEIDFPTLDLNSVAGDGEGGVEMTRSSELLLEVCGEFRRRNQQQVRILFPDATEAKLQGFQFKDSNLRIGHLTEPSPWLDLGWDAKKKPVAETAKMKEDDDLFIAAYPHFNVNEILAVRELHEVAADTQQIVIFNGELDRIRSGYYPKFFYPALGQLAEEWLPSVETLYYIHNFKGAQFGTLFRVFPGPWQVLHGPERTVVHTQSERPMLAEVAEILSKQSSARLT